MHPEIAAEVVRLLEDEASLSSKRVLEYGTGERGKLLLRYFKLFRSLADDLSGEVAPDQIRAEITEAPRDRCCLIEVFYPALRYSRRNYMPPEIYAYMVRVLAGRGISVPPPPQGD